jgi:flagellar protein FliO/FliZ
MTRILAPVALSALVAVPSATQAAPGVEAVDLSGVVMSLALVVGFILAAAFVVKRTPFAMVGKRGEELKIVAALPIGPRERLLLVEARGEELLIAVSPAGVFNVRASGGVQRAPADVATAFSLPRP